MTHLNLSHYEKKKNMRINNNQSLNLAWEKKYVINIFHPFYQMTNDISKINK